MQDIAVLKETLLPGTPLFLFECRCSPTQVFFWSTHNVSVDGNAYDARVIEHSPLEYRMTSGEDSAFSPRISIRLANADKALSSLTAQQLWKGAEITIRFVLFSLDSDAQLCDTIVMLRGTINSPDEVDYKTIRLSVVNRIGAYRAHLPALRVQKRCVWLFPRTSSERAAAVDASGSSRYSPFYGCGYSPDVAGGRGNFTTASQSL